MSEINDIEAALARLANLPSPWLEDRPPREIVAALDRYIIGQDAAKKAIAIAVRNRWRRSQVPESLRDEITPSNIILIGPTGVGKTEVARRLARLAGAPFIKVEASKFTEVGYVGRDVESMVRDLADAAIALVREEREEEMLDEAEERADDILLDLLLPPPPPASESITEEESEESATFVAAPDGVVTQATGSTEERRKRSRSKLRKLLMSGGMDDREVDIEVTAQSYPGLEMMQPPSGIEGPDANFTEWLRDMIPRRKKRRTVKVPEARRILTDEELRRLVDMDDVIDEALSRIENHGIIFIDEIDKIAGERATAGPDVSREGVQRDLLPIVEGSAVQTRYGIVRTDHILFIAAGAFHVSKPSDLIPELQGRFPIRVELSQLTEADFVRIMTEPQNALTKQYSALVETEGAAVEFTEDGVAEIARVAAIANDRMENIGARRLHTVMATLMEDLLFDIPVNDAPKGSIRVVFDAKAVRERLARLVDDSDLRRYIL